MSKRKREEDDGGRLRVEECLRDITKWTDEELVEAQSLITKILLQRERQVKEERLDKAIGHYREVWFPMALRFWRVFQQGGKNALKEDPQDLEETIENTDEIDTADPISEVV